MGSTLLKAFVGGAVIFECSYKPEDKHQRKRFCKTDDTLCLSSATSQPSDTRISLFDTNDGYFRILISALKLNDTGMYMCIVGTTPNVTTTFAKSLIVTEDPFYMQSIVKSGYVGRDVVINCPYPADSNGTVKYFYRQRDMSKCPEVISSWGPGPNSRHDLVDDSSAQVFNVTIRNLTAEDTGMYWCGVRAGGALGGIAMTTEVKLQVFGDFLMSTTEHGTLISSVTETPPVLTHSTLSTEMVVIILLILTVVVILLGVVVCRCRSKSRQGSVVALSVAAAGAIQMDPCYESVDPKNPQLQHDYHNLHPDPIMPDVGDPEAKPTTRSSPSGHVYETLRVSRVDADNIYVTVIPEPNE